MVKLTLSDLPSLHETSFCLSATFDYLVCLLLFFEAADTETYVMFDFDLCCLTDMHLFAALDFLHL